MANVGKLSKRLLLEGLIYGGLLFFVGGCAGLFAAGPRAKENRAVFQAAQQMFDQGQFQQAMAFWEKIPPPDALYLDARLGIRAARLKIEEIKDQEAAASRRLSQIDALAAQAEQLEQQGDLAAAVQKYEEARRLEPKNPALIQKIDALHTLLNDAREQHARLGDLYLTQGEYAKSKAEWEQLLQADATNEKAKQRLADIEVLTATSDTVFVKRGETLIKKGLLNAAKAEFEKARRVNPANERTQTYLAKLADFPFTDYTVKKGERLATIAQKQGGGRAGAQILADFNNLSGKTALKAGQVVKIPHVLGFKKTLAPKAKDIWADVAAAVKAEATTRALETPAAPETREAPDVTLNKGVTAFQEGNYREAISLLQSVLLQDPENEQAYTYFVRASEIVQRGTTASEITPVAAAETAPAAENPPPAEQPPAPLPEVQAQLRTGLAYREKGDLKNALAAFEQAALLEPQNAEARKNLEETQDELKKAITAHLNEGIKHFNQEALEDAIAEWNKVLELDPSNRQASEYKERASAMLKTLAPH